MDESTAWLSLWSVAASACVPVARPLLAKLTVDHTGKSSTQLPEHMVPVIDKASMVDLLSAYRLVRMLPDAARVLWVGDEAQLPPVGPGLVFDALMNSELRRFDCLK